VQNLANFLQRDEVIHRNAIRRQIDGDFCDVNRPGKCGVGFSTIGLIVPEDAAGRFTSQKSPSI